jgi:hypothetical protein
MLAQPSTPSTSQSTTTSTSPDTASATSAANDAARIIPRYAPAELTVRLDQAWRVLGTNQDIIRSADQKVYLLIVTSALLATFIANNIERILNMGMLQKSLLVLFLVSSATFFVFALRTLFARGAIKPNTASSTAHHGLIFFGDIYHHGSPASYAQAVRNVDLNEFYDDLAKQAFYVSEIATHKYIAYRRAWAGLLCAVVMFLALEFSIVFLAN